MECCCENKAPNLTDRELMLSVKNNCLKIRLNLAYALLDESRRKNNALDKLKATLRKIDNISITDYGGNVCNAYADIKKEVIKSKVYWEDI